MMLQEGPCVRVITDHDGPVRVGVCVHVCIYMHAYVRVCDH